MLRNNPRLVVYALHDCSVEGCLLAARLLHEPAWFQGTGARVIDVGLRLQHTKPFKALWLPQAAWAGPDRRLSQAENAWLSRWTLELAAIRPEQVIKRLFKGISATPEAGDHDGAPLLDIDAFGSDAGASDGGGDSFG
jgi:hypothetical protein